MLLPNTPQQTTVTAAQKYATHASNNKPLLTVSPRTLVLILSFIGLLLLFGVGYLLLQFINSNNVNPSNPSAQINSNVLLSMSPSSGNIDPSGSNIDLNINTQGTSIIVAVVNISYDATKMDVQVSKGTTGLNDLFNAVVSNGNIKIESGTGGTFNSNGILAKLQVTPKSGVTGSLNLQILSNSELALETGAKQLFAASVYKSYSYTVGSTAVAIPSSVSLSPSSGTLSASGTDIALNISAPASITAVSVNIQYDPSQLDIIVTSGGTGLDSLFIQTVSGGNINVQGGTNAGFSGNGKLANIKVTPKSGFSGNTSLKILSNSITADTNGSTSNISSDSLKTYTYAVIAQTNNITVSSTNTNSVTVTTSKASTASLVTTSKSSTTTVPNTALIDDLRQSAVIIFSLILIFAGFGFTYVRNQSIRRFGV